MLNRIGNKSKLLPSLLPLFPAGATTFIDLFAGSLSVSFAMLDRAKYDRFPAFFLPLRKNYIVLYKKRRKLAKTCGVFALPSRTDSSGAP